MDNDAKSAKISGCKSTQITGKKLRSLGWYHMIMENILKKI
jgi:hypothetical protein